MGDCHGWYMLCGNSFIGISLDREISRWVDIGRTDVDVDVLYYVWMDYINGALPVRGGGLRMTFRPRNDQPQVGKVATKLSICITYLI